MNESAQIVDRDEFHNLVRRNARPLFQLAYRMTGNRNDAEDLVQETFLRAWKQMSKFDGRASFGTWLHRICANCSLDLLRARARRKNEDEHPMERIAAAAPSPERLAMSGEVAGILGPALDELSPQERAAFVMRHYEGLGIDQIATVLDVQPGAAKHSVFRAVQKLRRALEPVAARQKMSVEA